MNPIILYDNRFNDGIPAATDTAAGFDVLNIRDLRPFTLWQAASPGTKYITVDCGSAKSADCLALIRHNLYSSSASVSVESSTTGAWAGEQVERLAPFTPSSDKALLKTFPTATARYWRLKIVTAAIAPNIGVAMLGAKLLFPYPPDTPYIPYKEGIEAETSRGKTGDPLGVVVRFKPVEVNARFSVLSRTWALSTYKAFWDTHASDLKPFFYVWDIDLYPDLVLYLAVKRDAAYQTPVSVLEYVDYIELDMEGIKE
jgi:hypothetical protein